MKMKSSRKFLALLSTGVFMVSLLLGAASAVSAGSGYSSYGYYTTAGNSYKNRSSIHTNHNNNHKAHATTSVTYRGSGNVGAGWMGVKPRRFAGGGGGLLCTGTWYYNSGAASGTSAGGCSINNHSSYASDGQTRAWHGSGYYTYGAFTSTSQNS